MSETTEKQTRKEKVIDFLALNFGVVIIAISVYFFKYPNHFAMGGISGLSIILGAISNKLSPATAAFIINIILLIVALIVFGKNFAYKTTYATILLSVLLMVFEKLFPMTQPLTDEPLLEMFFAIGGTAIGSALLFNQHASSGGTDIIAMIIKKYVSIDIGTALLVSDLLIVAATYFIFGVKTFLLSLTGLVLKGVIVDSLIDSLNRVKYFTIVTTKPELVGPYIVHTLKRGTTKFIGYGGYTGQERTVFLCVVQRYQAVMLRDYVKSVDPQAFLMITNTSEIVGQGFHSPF